MILRQPFTGSVSVRICKGGGQQLSLPVDAVLVGYMVLVGIHDFWMWQVAAERRFDVVTSGGFRTSPESYKITGKAEKQVLPLMPLVKNATL